MGGHTGDCSSIPGSQGRLVNMHKQSDEGKDEHGSPLTPTRAESKTAPVFEVRDLFESVRIPNIVVEDVTGGSSSGINSIYAASTSAALLSKRGISRP